MPIGPTYTKNNYCTVDGGQPWLIKTATANVALGAIAAKPYSPALIFNMASGSVDPFSVYVPGAQIKPVIPLLMMQTSSGASAANFSLVSNIFTQLSAALAWVPTVVGVASKIVAQNPLFVGGAYNGISGDNVSGQGGFAFSQLDFNAADFIVPAVGGTVFPFYFGPQLFASNYANVTIVNPLSGDFGWYPLQSAITDASVQNYACCFYAELQQ